MLLELSVARIALIESIHLELGKGLCVFTGETGAGKSILLDAIGLLLGNRASADLIRQGAEHASVEGTFAVEQRVAGEVHHLLDEWDINFDAHHLVVSRKLYRNGRTVCRINGQMATVQMLKSLGIHLIQQHGQHESQALLRPDEQIRLLDAFGQHDDMVSRVQELYHEWSRAMKELENAEGDEQEQARRLDMLQFQMQEIADARLTIGDEEELRNDRDKLAHVEKIESALSAALELLDGNDTAAVTQTTQALNSLHSVTSYDNDISQVVELLDTAQVNLDEAVRQLSNLTGRLESNPQQLQEIEDRLALIRSLERKYGPSIEAILEYYERIVEEYNQYQNRDERLNEMRRHVDALQKQLETETAELHDARIATSKRFSDCLSEVLTNLQMPNASFQIDVKLRNRADNLELGPQGADVVTFLFSANKGAEPKPLQKIASGGELSRTMLSIKSVLADIDDVESLVFDEIDTGVSGSAAQRVAEQLLQLGGTRQVLCVTHSPQIAAAGHSHYQIVKRERDEDTITEVGMLDSKGRVAEIARLLGSDLADDTAIRHAQAMLDSFGPITPITG